VSVYLKQVRPTCKLEYVFGFSSISGSQTKDSKVYSNS
jgi:hypothetical protein